MNNNLENSIGVVSAMYAHRSDDGLYIHMSFGRIVDQLATQYDTVYLSVPVCLGAKTESRDYRISAPNVVTVPQPAFTSSVTALRHPFGIIRSYLTLCRETKILFIRGMVPYVGLLYLLCFLMGVRPCHWLVGNPEALLKTHKRGSRIKMIAVQGVARFDRISTKIGRRLCGGSFLCNGRELGELYRSSRTWVVVSSTVLKKEIFFREDACSGEILKILFVGFLRPEKGLEYLLEALAGLKVPRDWRLKIVGDFDTFGAYREKITRLIGDLGIADKIEWKGYVPYGPKMFSIFRNSDLMVLPTLSEGTPRVLVEARAFGLPVVASNVGGIPSSVTDGFDGLLVPAKSPGSISAAIERIVRDQVLRKSLVDHGYESVSNLTVESFVEKVVEANSGSGPNHEQV